MSANSLTALTTLKNHKGFTTLEVLIILLIVAIIAGAGVVAWRNQPNKSKTTADSIPAKAKKTKAKPTNTLYKIKELGIEFSVPASLENMNYKVENITNSDGSTSPAAYLNDPALLPLAKKCEAGSGAEVSNDSVNFAAVSLIKGAYSAKSADVTDGTFIKQFNDSYVTYSVPNGAICGSDDQSVNDAWFKGLHDSQEAFSAKFKQTVKKLN